MPRPPTDLIAAVGRRAGARYFRLALQVNPWAYVERRGRDPKPAQSEDEYNEILVAALQATGVEAIAVTDHDSVKSSASLITAAGEAGIVAFPGFEVGSKEGVHVLAVFPADRSLEAVDRALFKIIDDEGELSQNSLTDVLSTIRGRGGLPILPHIDRRRGLLTVLDGEARINAWSDPSVLAVAITKPVDQLNDDIRAMVLGEEVVFRRDPMPAVIYANDVFSPEHLELPQAVTDLKMTGLTLDGIHHAFMDPESRVRLPVSTDEPPRPEVLALHWAGGFMDDTTQALNPGLNAVIGGRGAGKSTVLRSLRFVLGLEPLTSASADDHESFVDGVLRPGSEVWAAIRSVEPDNEIYYIRRVVGEDPRVFLEDGTSIDLHPRDLRFRLEIFAQHELAEVAREQHHQVELVRRYMTDEADILAAIEGAQVDLIAQREEVEDLEDEIVELVDQVASLPGKRETLRRYHDSGLAERLGRKPVIERERRLLEQAAKLIADDPSTATAAYEEAEELSTQDLAAQMLEDSPTAEHVTQAFTAVNGLSKLLESKAEDLIARFKAARAAVAEARTRWAGAADKEIDMIDAELREIGAAGESEASFLRLQAEIDDLESKEVALKRARRRLSAALKRRSELLADLREAQGNRDAEFQRAANRSVARLVGTVRVTVTPRGSFTPLSDLLQRLPGGRLKEGLAALRRQAEQGELDLDVLAHAIREGPETLEALGIPPGTASNIADAGEELSRLVEELDVPPSVSILLRLGEGAEADWKPLRELSTGQKATALILLALAGSAGAGPLVIDQPENDLDTEFIVTDVVQRLRDAKVERQFLFATHNPNIPVLADAELVIALGATGEASTPEGRAVVLAAGSIDVAGVRDLVAVLDGGRQAFETRRRRYGY